MTANSHVYTWLRCSDVLPLRGEQQATRSCLGLSMIFEAKGDSSKSHTWKRMA